ncbi:hypothetical protein M433DRAFT_109311 [Acidomyces richmondensis BFW]|nr:MAG: hypothetical protein FE78DRAFT_169871 [Acidomyces sp. 'richmondensis']KYG44893.1 hypothetical protein M433DRAFT_109311 [Acidomyces richmondensis BFW]
MQPHRILSCVACQKRKVKCDRKFPCANCVKAGIHCVQVEAPRQRRRRFPERDLLERVRYYESLLQQHHIKFEPLHKNYSTVAKDSIKNNAKINGGESRFPSNDQSPSPQAIEIEPLFEAKNFFRAMNLTQTRDAGEDNDSNSSNEQVGEDSIRTAWDECIESGNDLLFGSRKGTVDVSSFHPGQAQIFKLWQLYLENVDPLLKITHTPTLQSRIIDATSNICNISHSLHALMFAIYCIVILSLDEGYCLATFGSCKRDLLNTYQFGCQQALLNCQFMRSSNREILTALLLFLLSIREQTDPQSLSSMLAVAMRIAQRMGIQYESTYTRYTAFEAEMCRRLWWALVLFDARIAEMDKMRTSSLVPTWDCKPAMNANDLDLRPEMKELPNNSGNTSEALFVVVRSILGEFVRHSTFYLDFTVPALKALAKNVQHPVAECGSLETLENMMEDKYFQFCNPENPLHFMAMWITRAHIAKYRLLEYYAQYSGSCAQQTDAQRDTAISHALRMIECDTKLIASPLIRGYTWYLNLYFPMPAYVHIVQDLRRRPLIPLAERCWKVMSENYELRISANIRPDHAMNDRPGNPFLRIFGKVILQGWKAREEALGRLGRSVDEPQLITSIRQRTGMTTPSAQSAHSELVGVAGMDMDHLSTSIPSALAGPGQPYDVAPQGLIGLDDDVYFDSFSYPPMGQLDWSSIGWGQLDNRGCP